MMTHQLSAPVLPKGKAVSGSVVGLLQTAEDNPSVALTDVVIWQFEAKTEEQLGIEIFERCPVLQQWLSNFLSGDPIKSICQVSRPPTHFDRIL